MDSWLDLNTANPLGRIDSRIDKNKLVAIVAKKYRLGNIIKFNQILEGYEDYNIKLETNKGKFLIKMFSQFKSFRHVKDNVTGLKEFHSIGMLVPKLIPHSNDQYLFYYEENELMALICVMEYFNGRSFFKNKKEPSYENIKLLTQQLALLHTSKFKPNGIYDIWTPDHLVDEFSKKSRFLTKEEKSLITPVVQKLKKINLSKCEKATIHKDVQRSNVLIDKKGNIRIIDFSVMDYAPIVLELAIFIALFAINPWIDSPELAKEKYQVVIDEYQKYKKLNKYELSIIPILVLATYGANTLPARYEYEVKGNKTEETQYWIDIGVNGIKLFNKIPN